MEINEGLQAFVLQLRADGRSPHTIDQYRRHVGLLARWMERTGLGGDVARLGHQDLARFLSSRMATDRACGGVKQPATMNSLRSSVRGFFGYLHAAGTLTSNPARLVRRATCGTPPPRGLSPDEERRLLEALEAGRGRAAARDRALIALLLGTGLRISAALALQVEDVDLARGELLVRTNKGGRTHQTFLQEGTGELLRGLFAGRESGPVFEGCTGRPLTRRHAARRLRLWLERAGCRPASPHALRHTVGQRVYDATGDLHLVRAVLGHASIASSQRYAAVNDERLRRFVSARAGFPANN